MSQEIRRNAYLTDICEGLKEKADDSVKQKSQDGYDIGYAMAMYEVMSLLYQQAQVFDIPLCDLGLQGIDPERDYLCANQLNIRPDTQSWEKLESTYGAPIPFLDTFKFDGTLLELTLQFSEFKKKLVCEHVLCFRMIQEGCAFHTLATQKFDGEAWLFKTNQSELLADFNFESESIYADSIHAYIVVTQDQIVEFLTEIELKIIERLN